MELNLSTIEKFLLVPLEEGDKLKKIEHLSTMFTRRRDQIELYGFDRALVSAYTSYFLLSNMAKLDFLLQQLHPDILQQLQRCNVVDFGCGPGTYAIAWAQYFQNSQCSIYEYDRSELMLEQSKKLVGGLELAGNWSWHKNSLPTVESPSCLLFGNSFNELSEQQMLEVVDRVRPLFILFIEPGTKEVFAKIIKSKQPLRDRGYSTIYPCLLDDDCPMTKDNWCHQIVHTRYEQDYERMCQKLRKDRRKQPATIHLYKKGYQSCEKITDDCLEVRIIRLLKETKFSLLFEVCTIQDKHNNLLTVEILKRNFSKKAIKSLLNLSWGSSLYLELERCLDNKIWRANIVGDRFV